MIVFANEDRIPRYKALRRKMNLESWFPRINQDEIFDKSIRMKIPLVRPQTSEAIGQAVAFFASDEAHEITGQTLNIDGGAGFN